MQETGDKSRDSECWDYDRKRYKEILGRHDAEEEGVFRRPGGKVVKLEA